MYFVYSLLMGVAAVLLLPYWIIVGLRQGKYFSNLGQRLGLSFPGLGKLSASQLDAGAIWIHAVSVGEALSCVPLAKRLKSASVSKKIAWLNAWPPAWKPIVICVIFDVPS